MEVVARHRGGEPGGLDPAHRHTGVVDDEEPAAGRETSCGPGGGRSSLRHLGAKTHGRLRREGQVGGVPEAERAVAAVPADEVRDKVVDRVGQEPLRGVDLREATADPEDGHLVAERDRLVDVMRDKEDRFGQITLQRKKITLELGADDRVDR